MLPAGLQRVARERYGAREGLVVLSVFDDVREGKKGLQAGDLIVALNGRAIDEIADLSRRSDPHVRIELLRAGKPLSIEANPAVGCRFPAELHLSEEVNAYATGESVSVTTAFMREFSDDTMVAMVVGHELAHDFMEDTRRTRDGSQRRREARADHLGIYLAVMAGYPVTEKLDLYLELERDLNLLAARSQSHPITADRAAAYLKTIEEIEQRRAAGLPLLQEP